MPDLFVNVTHLTFFFWATNSAVVCRNEHMTSCFVDVTKKEMSGLILSACVANVRGIVKISMN